MPSEASSRPPPPAGRSVSPGAPAASVAPWSGPPPLATYRIQLTATFGFDAATDLLDHLVDLGVSHVYLSPVLQAVPGSRHGYDVIDPHLVDLDRGGEHAFRRLADTAHDRGLGVLLDIVPNHLAADPRSPAWADVLRHGRASGMARWFDLGWAHGTVDVPDRLLLPILGDDLDVVVAAGDVRLGRTGHDLVLRVYDQCLPLCDESVAEIVDAVASALEATAGPEGADEPDAAGGSDRRRFATLAHAFQQRMLDADHGGSPADDHRVVCILGGLADHSAEIGNEIDALLAAMSSDPGTLDWVLERQHYRLAHWREARTRLDRRRFFDVAELVGVRQEDPDVFAATHTRVLNMVAAGQVDGLRVDHPDGLADPTGYLQRLRHEIGDRWLVVEKILVGNETVPGSWPVDGTTGYEQAAALDRLFVVPAAEVAMTEFVTTVAHGGSGDNAAPPSLDAVVRDAKQDALAQLFETELRRLTALGLLVAHQRMGSAGSADGEVGENGESGESGEPDEIGETDVRRALVALVVACPVYRTYVRDGQVAGGRDRRVLDEMFASAAAMLSADGVVGDASDAGDAGAAGADGEARSAVATLQRFRPVFDHAERTATEESFVVRLQQLTAAVTAKGVEDTAFYRLPRLVSLCEVGADPRRWSIDVDEFHAQRARTAAIAPLGMAATSTHDSKRSADARARLTALTEIPDRWIEAASTVATRLDELIGADRRDPLVDLQLVQLVLAAHPADVDRLTPVAVKAAREAKRRTSWLRPSASYEADVAETIRVLVTDPVCRRALDPLLDDLVPRGRRVSLASLLLTLAGPGVPDLYQGSLGWRTALADPDNRADPDVAVERELLRRAVAAGADSWSASAIATDEFGVAKAHLVRTALLVRRAHPMSYAPGSTYAPLVPGGRAAPHVISHTMVPAHGRPEVVVVAVRWSSALHDGGGWGDTFVDLPDGAWRDALVGDAVSHRGRTTLAALVGDRPGALLHRV